MAPNIAYNVAIILVPQIKSLVLRLACPHNKIRLSRSANEFFFRLQIPKSVNFFQLGELYADVVCGITRSGGVIFK